MQEDNENFIQSNSPDGGFLQSEEWRKFQEAVGRKTYIVSNEDFHASVIEHELPVVGKYFYVPRGPLAEITNYKSQITNKNRNTKSKIQNGMAELINLARKNKAGWIRVEPQGKDVLDLIRTWTSDVQVVKAPHEMQSRETLIIDITKSEEELLVRMKPKTRYNIRLAEKRGVRVFAITNNQDARNKQITNSKSQITNKSQIQNSNDQNRDAGEYVEEFLWLVKVTAERDGIISHPGNYYRKMLEILPGDMLKLYVAEHEGKIIAANLVVFYGKTCTYLHGASANENRNVMAPYALQWKQIQDAKAVECERYDFCGIMTRNKNSWAGITRFKLGFSPETKPVEFPGCYDIIVNPGRYWMYRGIQWMKAVVG